MGGAIYRYIWDLDQYNNYELYSYKMHNILIYWVSADIAVGQYWLCKFAF